VLFRLYAEERMSAVDLRKPSKETPVPDFERIYREYSPLVYRTAYGVLGNSQDAEEVLQTIFLRLIRRECPPDLQRNPKAYLYRAAVNLSLDTIEERRRHVLNGEADRLAVQPPADDSDLDEELHKRLYEGIAQLSPQAAEAVILKYLHNMRDTDIAKVLGKSRGVVAVTLYRARARLKKLLRKPQQGDGS
jgi:RNA polymerase sigma-70 factor (ECF subfamily)